MCTVEIVEGHALTGVFIRWTGMDHWTTGMDYWNTGMEYWNGLLEWLLISQDAR